MVYFKELLNGKGAASCIELPSSVWREVDMEEIGLEEVESAIHNMTNARRQGQMCMKEGRIPNVCFSQLVMKMVNCEQLYSQYYYNNKVI